MVCCSVYGCNNNHRKKELTFFRFPKDENLMKQWIWACRRKDQLNMKTARICSVHFQESDQYRSLQHELLGYTPKCSRKIKVDAVPSLHLPLKTEPNVMKNNERINRIVKRDRHKLATSMLETSNTSGSTEIHQESAAEYVIAVNQATKILVDHSDPNRPVNVNTSGEMEIVSNENLFTSSLNEVAEAEPTTSSKPLAEEVENQEIIFIAYDDADLNAQNSKDKLIRVLLNENRELKAEVEGLKRHVKQLNTDRKAYVSEILRPIFTEGQIKCLLQDYRKRIQWSPEDIAAAKVLKNISVDAYQYLRNSLNFPLPGVSTLRRCKSVDADITEEVVDNGNINEIELDNVNE